MMKSISKNQQYLNEVTKAYLKCGKPLSKKRELELQQNNYKTKYRLYNIDKTKYKEMIKRGFSFSHLRINDQAKIYSYIFKNTDYMGVGFIAIDWFKSFQNKKSINLIEFWPLLKTWSSKIENWAHGDMICSLYCDMLSIDQKLVYPELEKWNNSSSPWKIRASIVSLLYYYNPKRNLLPFNKIIKMIRPHLSKDHYYLQKAIGWNLRELNNSYPDKYLDFMTKNVLKISSTAFSTSVEKLDKKNKEKLKSIRREARSKKKAIV